MTFCQSIGPLSGKVLLLLASRELVRVRGIFGGVILMQKKAVAFTGHRPESLPFGRDMHSGRYDDFELILWKEIRRCMDEG